MNLYSIFGKSKNKKDGDIFSRSSYFIPIIGLLLIFIKPPVTDDAGLALGILFYHLIVTPATLMFLLIL